MPPIYASVLKKAQKGWDKLPTFAQQGIKQIFANRYARIGVSTALATGTSYVFGMAATAGVGAYAGYRLGRAVVGGAVSLKTGKMIDVRTDKKNEQNRKEFAEQGKAVFNPENLEKTAKDIEDFLKKEDKKKFNQKIAKTAAMIGAGGATVMAGGFLESLVTSHIPNLGNVFTDHIDKTGVRSGPRLPESVGKSANLQENMEKMMKEGVGDRTLNAENKLNAYVENKPSVESTIAHNPEAQVDFTSKGSIDAIHRLKADILAKYSEAGKTIPPALQEKIMNKTPLEIAKELGFYKPDSNASALVLKGESLGIDNNGDIYYQHLNGDKQIMFDSNSGEIDDFDGKMLTPKVADPLFKNSNVFPNEKIGDDVYPKVGFTDEALANTDSGIGVKADNFDFGADQHLGPTTTDGGIDTTIINDEPIIPVNEDALVGNVTTNEAHIPLSNGKFVDVMTVNNERGVLYNGVSIAHEKAFGGGKMLVLDDQFQDGAKFSEARGAFAQAFEHTAKTDVLGPNPIAEPFEGGMIYGAHGIPTPDHISLLLNGKEIAKGQIVNGIPKIKINPDLKGGWLFADNVYERAFKHMDKVIKSGVKNGTLNFSNH